MAAAKSSARVVNIGLGVQNRTVSENRSAENAADSQHVPPAWREQMHGGMNLLDGPAERFQRRAESYMELAMEVNDPEHQRLWYDLALDCLRIAATVRELASLKLGSAASSNQRMAAGT
jgi:hypothetical protein